VPYGLPADVLAAGWDGVRSAAEAAGRDPASITCSLWAPITVTPRDAAPGPEGLPLYGPPELLVERLVEYSKAGLQHFLMFNFCDAAATAEQVEQIATEVLPHVKGLVGRGAS
jgi:alkanesulfonate monooxygenase SsuD/methylene tetrahydromethanopterin reductase-like flavin-dependent oxidoreductase (luciferase family)